MALYSGDSTDEVFSGTGDNDIFEGGGGNDTFFGGAGDDFILATDFSVEGNASVEAGSGNDEVALTYLGAATVDGGAGNDILALYWSAVATEPVDIAIAGPDPHAVLGDVELASFSGFEQLRLYSGAGNDTVTGGDLSDWITTGSGEDQVDAGAGDDEVGYIIDDAATLEGGSGNDLLAASVAGSSGYFVVDGLTGAVDDGELAQISGFERYSLRGNFGNDLGVLGAGDDLMTGQGGNDTGFGRDGNDTLSGDDGLDSLAGDAGQDSLKGGRQDDLLEGGGGKDTLHGGAQNDQLYGGGGDDFLQSAAGEDFIFGGDGDDRLRGHFQGNDTMTGGLGADRFINDHTQWGFHLITDFETGVDRLELLGSALSPGLTAGVLDPSMLSVGTAVGAHGQFVLRYDAAADETQLLWDSNGQTGGGGFTAVMRFEGNVLLDASDILIL